VATRIAEVTAASQSSVGVVRVGGAASDASKSVSQSLSVPLLALISMLVSWESLMVAPLRTAASMVAPSYDRAQ
jgi:L-cystine uptake protein TcyP (sodium:dicarboxylate symporter family)